jgi:hypothetical protein
VNVEREREKNTMNLLQHGRSFRDRMVYQKARAAKRVFEVTKRLPKE